jgi:hypothetical protein
MKPPVAITLQAPTVHGITDTDLEQCPISAQIWQGQWVMTWDAAVHGEPHGQYEYQYRLLKAAPVPRGPLSQRAATVTAVI